MNVNLFAYMHLLLRNHLHTCIYAHITHVHLKNKIK